MEQGIEPFPSTHPPQSCGNICSNRGFTLIELSIVLIIIGLIVGGILVGRDLISAAAVRAQISQIEKYQQAVNTFKGKYGYLPGDIPDPDASRFGFAARSPLPGQGDGNGVLKGVVDGGSGWWRPYSPCGETGMFWRDLSQVALIDGAFILSTPDASNIDCQDNGGINGTNIAKFYPPAKIGGTSYVYIWSGGAAAAAGSGWTDDNTNYFGLSSVIDAYYDPNFTVSLTAKQAYDIDSKIDDGLPQSGKVLALYPIVKGGSGGSGTSAVPSYWAASSTSSGDCEVVPAGAGVSPYCGPVISGSLRTTPDTTTCYDTRNAFNGKEQYSVTTNNGRGMNCALSFKFQ